MPSRDELPERWTRYWRSSIWCSTKATRPRPANRSTRPDLSAEAIRLARLVVELLPDPDAQGLLALLLLQESRRLARTSPTGDLVLLEDQDRSLWNRRQIAEGQSLVERVLAAGQFGAYTLQAAIAAVHAAAPTAAATDWAQVVALYDLLARAQPSPIVELNRAVAVAMRDGPAEGLRLIDALLARGELADYHFRTCRPSRFPPEAGAICQRAPKLSAGDRFGSAGTGTPVSRQAVGGTGLKDSLRLGCRFRVAPSDYQVKAEIIPRVICGESPRIP